MPRGRLLRRLFLRGLAVAVFAGVAYMMVTGRGVLPSRFGLASFTWRDDPFIFIVAAVLYIALGLVLWFHVPYQDRNPDHRYFRWPNDWPEAWEMLKQFLVRMRRR